MTTKSRQEADEILEGLPASTPADDDAQRRARDTPLDRERIEALSKATPQASYAALARRSVTRGEPFRL